MLSECGRMLYCTVSLLAPDMREIAFISCCYFEKFPEESEFRSDAFGR